MDEHGGLSGEAKPTQMTLEREVTEGDRSYQITATAMPDGRTAICILSGPINADDFNELSGIIAKEDLAMIARAFRPELAGIAAWHGITIDDGANSLAALRLKHPNAYTPWTDEQEETLLELHAEGASFSRMAKELGRQVGAIRQRLDKLGVLT